MERATSINHPRGHAWAANVLTAGFALLLAFTMPLCANADDLGGQSRSAWFPSVHLQALLAPLPAKLQYAFGIIPDSLPKTTTDLNVAGLLGTYSVNGPIKTSDHAFFQSLGSNGRACVTCHQPSDGMSISVGNVRSRYLATRGEDPLFAPVDGANCPNAVPESRTKRSPLGALRGKGKAGAGVANIRDPSNPHSLLLNHGLIRVFMPWPPIGSDGGHITPEFTLEVLSDPTKCNNDTTYGLKSSIPMVSVYRRPLMSSNLKFVTTLTTLFPPVDPLSGIPQPLDPFTGAPQSGNIMWDGREATLHSQAVHATLGHAQAFTPPTAEQVQQMVDFEKQIFSAQIYDFQAHSLTDQEALGGPVNLAGNPAGVLGAPDTFDEYSNWMSLPSHVEQFRERQSVARGQAIFNRRTFTIANVAGFNDVSFVGNNFNGSCATCHNAMHGGTDVFPNAVRDLGTSGNHPAALPAPDLPLFRLTCKGGISTSFNGTTVTIRDPGKALLTGKCGDIGKIKVPQLRALAARPPYFHDGSAPNLEAVVEFYNKRFDIRFTSQEEQDLINFLKAL